MLERRHFDTTYHGNAIAPWILGLVVAVKITQSLGIFLGGESIVRAADGIPLDTYAPAAARTVLSLFALLAYDRLLIGLLAVLVLVRYRGMIAPMFTLLLLHDLGKHAVLRLLPLDRVGTPMGPIMNLVLLALTTVGLALSVWSRGRVKTEAV